MLGNCIITKKLKGKHVLVQLEEFQSKSSQPFQGWRKRLSRCGNRVLSLQMAEFTYLDMVDDLSAWCYSLKGIR